MTHPYRVPHYPDKSDYETNAGSYYDDLARKNELMKHLAMRIWEYDKELAKRFAAWDQNLEAFDDEVIRLLKEWIDDGTFAHIINEEIFQMKLDRSEFTATIEEIQTQLQTIIDRVNNLAIDLTAAPFNAKPGTDITDILIAAVDEIHARGGGVIRIPAGDYSVLGSVDLCSNISIIGDGNGTILRKGPVNSEAYLFNTGRTRKYGATFGYGGGAKNVKIEGIQFEGYAPSKIQYQALANSFHHCDGLVIRDCRFLNVMTRDHAIDLAGCSNVLIEHCSFEGAFNLEGREYTECIQIDTSAPGALPQFHSYDGLPTKDVTVRGCRFIPSYYPDGSVFNYAPHPIGTHGTTGGKPYENITFENNLVLDGPEQWNTSGWRAWIHFYGVKNLFILNNVFKNTRGYKAGAIGIYTSSSGRYDPNTLEATTGIPTQSSEIKIAHNTFEGFNHDSEGTDIIRLYGTEYQGVEYPVSRIHIVNNDFLNNAGDAYRVEEGRTCVHVHEFEFLVATGNTADKASRMFSVWDGKHSNISHNNAQDLSTGFLYHSDVEHTNVSHNVVDTVRMPLEIQEVRAAVLSGNVFTDCRLKGESLYAVKLRNMQYSLFNANVIQSNTGNMNYAIYVYQLEETDIARDVSVLDNLTSGFLIRPINQTGVIDNYTQR